jgi:hypothetical protein
LVNNVSAGWSSIYKRGLLKQAVFESVGQKCGFHKEIKLGSKDEIANALKYDKSFEHDISLIPNQEIVEAIGARLCELGKFNERAVLEELNNAEGRMSGLNTVIPAYEGSFKDAPSSEDISDADNLFLPSEYEKKDLMTISRSKVLTFVFGTFFGSFCTFLFMRNNLTPHNANTKLRRPEL